LVRDTLPAPPCHLSETGKPWLSRRRTLSRLPGLGLNQRMPSIEQLAPYAGYVLKDAAIPELPNHYRGKVRENYDLPDGRRIIIATDRLSAFDRQITSVPLKGQVLTQIARFWFDRTGDLCPNHVLEYPDPNVLVCQGLRIMPVEVVYQTLLRLPFVHHLS
jgi:phosphoribosylaminoimidazole-succinocarboxamide synthase